MNIVEIKNLSFKYKNNIIFDNSEISIHRNKLNFLIGASGSGKSTLLYILFLLLKPDSMEYIFEGKSQKKQLFWGISKFRKENISLLFQDFRLLPFLNVEENIKLPLLFTGKVFEKKTFNDLVDHLGIREKLKKYPYSLSGGEAQRVALARALFSKPKLVLLDEPTGNLDMKLEKIILEILVSLKAQTTFFCVTHSKFMYSQADVLYELKNKKIILKKNKSKSKK